MMTVRAIARKAGVSISTVSRVLNNHDSVSDELRNKVLSVVNCSGLDLPRRTRRDVKNTIAFLYAGTTSLGSPFDAALLEGIYGALADTHLQLTILELRRNRHKDETYSHMFQRLGIRGAVIRATHDTHMTCREIAEEDIPVVVVGTRMTSGKAVSVYYESRAASKEVVEYLISLGHRRIAISTNIVEDSDHQERLAGYREAFQQYNLDLDESVIYRVPGTRQGGAQLIRRIVTSVDRPTAVYITDPLAALGALHEAQKIGLRVPGDISIVGFDDSELRHVVMPTMTAVCQDAAELGREAYRMLTDLIKGKSPSDYTPPSAWFEIHESTGPAEDESPVHTAWSIDKRLSS